MSTRSRLRAGIATLALGAASVSAALGETPELKGGIAAFIRGDVQQAVKLFTTELEAPGRSPEDRARAFYHRARAYYASKQPVLAISDASAALWLNKLSPSEAADAVQLKSLAQSSVGADAGLPAFKLVTKSPPAFESTPAKALPAVVPPKPAPLQPEAQAAATLPSRPPQQAVVSTLPVAATPVVRPSAPAWSSASVTREELSQPAAPAAVAAEPPKAAAAWIASAILPSAAAVQQATGDIETGSIARAERSSVPESALTEAGRGPIPTTTIAAPVPIPQQTHGVAPVLSPAASLQQPTTTSAPQTDAPPKTAAANILPSLPVLGALFEPASGPLSEQVEKANEVQRQRYERIRRLNQAHNDAQNLNAQATVSGAHAD